MDREESWRVITEQRLGLARLLEGLSDDEWEQPSLCAGWRVRDVAAHVSLVALPPSPGSVLLDLLRARGNFHQLNTMASRRRAERAPDQLIADLRQHAGSRKIPIVSDQRNVLFDLLVHVQDIAIPLGIDLPMPVVAAAAGATRVWSMGWPFWARRRLRGLRLRATDTDWSAGAGAELRAPIRMLLAARWSTSQPHPSSCSSSVAHECELSSMSRPTTSPPRTWAFCIGFRNLLAGIGAIVGLVILWTGDEAFGWERVAPGSR